MKYLKNIGWIFLYAGETYDTTTPAGRAMMGMVSVFAQYGLGLAGEKTQREIASILGISRSYVSRIEKKALNKLWKEMNE